MRWKRREEGEERGPDEVEKEDPNEVKKEGRRRRGRKRREGG